MVLMLQRDDTGRKKARYRKRRKPGLGVLGKKGLWKFRKVMYIKWYEN